MNCRLCWKGADVNALGTCSQSAGTNWIFNTYTMPPRVCLHFHADADRETDRYCVCWLRCRTVTRQPKQMTWWRWLSTVACNFHKNKRFESETHFSCCAMCVRMANTFPRCKHWQISIFSASLYFWKFNHTTMTMSMQWHEQRAPPPSLAQQQWQKMKLDGNDGSYYSILSIDKIKILYVCSQFTERAALRAMKRTKKKMKIEYAHCPD